MNATIETVEEVLSQDIRESNCALSDVMFRERAACLLRHLLPALDWLGAHKDFPLNIDTIRGAFEWPWLCLLAEQRIVLLQDRRSGESRKFCTAWDMPRPLLVPLQRYVAEVARVIVVRGEHIAEEAEPERQHRFVTMYFMPGFTRLRCDIAHWVH